MRISRRLILALAAAVAGAALGALAPKTAVDGLANDVAAAGRAAVFGSHDFSNAKVAVISLDRRSIASPELQNLPRALMSRQWAALVDKALAHGARNVALDIILAFDPASIEIDRAKPLAGIDKPLLRLLLTEGRKGRVLIANLKEARQTETPMLQRKYGSIASARGVAYANFEADPDGVAREVATHIRTAKDERVQTIVGGLLGAQTAPPVLVTPPGALSTLPAASAIDVLRSTDDAALRAFFNDRSIVIGGGLPGEDRLRLPDRFMGDPRSSGGPFPKPDDVRDSARALPGAYLHAAAVDARLSGWELSPPAGWALAFVVGAFAAVAAYAGLMLRPVGGAVVAGALCVAGFAGAAAAQEAGLLFPAARPPLAALLGFGAGWAGQILLLDRRARALRASFGRYLAPALVDRIVNQARPPEIDGEQRRVTIMFADLSGFTALSEKVDGKTLTATVNAYLGLIAEEVERTGGYVDKFIGDAVMAIWNAPVTLEDHERQAVLAAVAIRDAVAAAAARDAKSGMPTFSIKIGVNSGDAIIGNVGAASRMNYTAVGDTVNVASRMEGLPSVLETPIVIGAACAEAARQDFAMLEAASIQVKGRKEPVAVFAPLAEPDRRHFADYEAALAAYRSREFGAAAEMWRVLGSAQWNGAALAAAMATFADASARNPPPDDWHGGLVMETK